VTRSEGPLTVTVTLWEVELADLHRAHPRAQLPVGPVRLEYDARCNLVSCVPALDAVDPLVRRTLLAQAERCAWPEPLSLELVP
jgi:hypothetical protein